MLLWQYVDIFDDLGSSDSSAGSEDCDGFEAFLAKVCLPGTHQAAQEASSLFRSKEDPSHMHRTLHPSSTRLRTVVAALLLRGVRISPVLNEQVTHLVVDFEHNYSVDRERALQVSQS